MSTLYRTAGLLGVALLALTACGDEGVPADDQTDEEDGGGTEGQDPDGAEEQGDQPEEIAGEDPEDEAGVAPDDDTMDPPSFAQIREDIWDSSLDHESVTITVLVEEDDEDAEEVPEIDAAEEPADGEDDAELGPGDEMVIAGSMTGDGSLHESPFGEQRLFDDGERVLQSNEFFVSTYEESRPEDAEGLQPDELEDWLQERGEWVHVTEVVDLEMIETPEAFIMNLREGFESAVSEEDAEGEVDTVNGENVWVYEIENATFMVAAEEDDPYLVGYEAAEVAVSFEHWDETDDAEEPDEDVIIEFSELEEAVMEATG